MSVEALKHFNPAFRSNMIDASAASYLILPAGHARQFRDALLAHASGTHGDGLLDGVDTSATVGSAPGEKVARKTHIVKRGESLWQIARNYSVNVSQLQRWNRLGGHALKPGQALMVSAPN